MLKSLIFALFFIAGPVLFANDAPPIKAHLSTDHTVITPGQEFTLLLEVDLAEGWHAYWKNPGDSGLAPSIDWQLPEGLSVTHTEWPTPERFENEEAVTYGYSHKIPFLVTVNAAPSLGTQSLEIHANIQWIICSNETCLPAKTPVNIHIQVGDKQEPKVDLKKRLDEVKEAMPKVLPVHLVEQKASAVVVSFPDEIALNDAELPRFFPETQGYKKLPKILKNSKSIEIPRTDEGSLKGVLVMGNNAYLMDFAPLEQQPASLDLFWALIFALLGGLILNLMPCVLPVVSLKVMSFVKMAGDSRKEMMKQGLAFTLGVLASFWFLAALLIGLKATGQSIGWGFQLQDPLFIAALALLFTFLALNLFGVFELGTSLASLAGDASLEKQSKGSSGSFWSGVFATAVATPCTGPFMGSALGYALTQPAYISFAVFTALGIGMSLPYLLIGFFPSCIRWLPKPGAWMESFKQFLGFLMLATVIWLLWVFNGQTSELGLFLLLFGLLIAAIGCWIYGRFGALHRKKSARRISYILTAIFLIGSAGLVKVASNQIETPDLHAHAGWEPFSAEKVAELRKTKRPVLIDFTAKWCLICQANHLVMTNREVSKKFEEHRVVLMKADWTRYDPVITEALKKFGRSGVPLYVLYGADEEPIILPQVLTPDAIISALEETQKKYVR